MLRSFVLPNFLNVTAADRPAVMPRRAAVSTRSAAWLKIAGAALVVANIVLLLSYLTAVNNNATKGYEIKKLQTQATQFTDENQKLNVKMSEISSMLSVQTDYLSAHFVPAGTPQFLQLNQLTRR